MRALFLEDARPPLVFTLSLHDALPICSWCCTGSAANATFPNGFVREFRHQTSLSFGTSGISPVSMFVSLGRSEEQRLNSSHSQISYAVFCLKKKKSNTSPALNTSDVFV